MDDEGTKYWHNPLTRTTTWTKPRIGDARALSPSFRGSKKALIGRGSSNRSSHNAGGGLSSPSKHETSPDRTTESPESERRLTNHARVSDNLLSSRV